MPSDTWRPIRAHLTPGQPDHGWAKMGVAIKAVKAGDANLTAPLLAAPRC